MFLNKTNKAISSLLIVLLICQFIVGIFIFPNQAQAETQDWTLTTSSNYTFDSGKIEISSGQAQLKATSTPAWYNTNWNYRKAITINNVGNNEIEINLTSANMDFTKAQRFGEDIRFTASDGTTLLPLWQKSHDQDAQTATYWIRETTNATTVYL